jgi:hypothetical protein
MQDIVFHNDARGLGFDFGALVPQMTATPSTPKVSTWQKISSVIGAVAPTVAASIRGSSGTSGGVLSVSPAGVTASGSISTNMILIGGGALLFLILMMRRK